MALNQRRLKILNLIREDGHAKVQDLSKIFKVTDVTIRQDLEELEKMGYIEREHGGALLKDVSSFARTGQLLNQKNIEEKREIAKKAINFINEGDCIILDSGSTTTEYLIFVSNIYHIPIMRFLILFLFILSTSLIQAQEVLLESKIKKSIENVPAQVGVAIIINGKDTITINNECHYPLMSVMKYPQALAVLHYLHQHNQPLSTKIFIPKEALLDDTYSPLRDKYPGGNIYMPIDQLLDYTIQKSDNNACDILFNYTGGVSYTDSYIRSLGINNFSISKTEDDMHEDLAACYENWSTPLEIASLTEMLFSKELFPTEYQNFLKETMLNCQTGTNRLPAPLLDTTARIGHKTGTSDRNVQGELIGINDVGFILLPDGKRYTIAVLVKNSKESMADTEKIIANISGIVYHHLVSEKNISNK